MKKGFKTLIMISTTMATSFLLVACGNSSSNSSDKEARESTTQQVKKKSSKQSNEIDSKSSSSITVSSSSDSAESTSSSSESSSTLPTSVTPQQMGIILAMNQEPEVIEEYLGNALWYGVDNETDGPTNGYNYISTHGDGTANIYWKVEGDNVTFKRMDPNSGTCVADEKLMTKTVPVSQLIQQYYATPEQQEQVNQDANKLKTGDN